MYILVNINRHVSANHGHPQVWPSLLRFHYANELWCGELNINRCYAVSIFYRWKEESKESKTNSHTSNYAKHILEQSHTSGPIHQTMQILQYPDKGTHSNTVERFLIYVEYSKNTHLNDEHSVSPNRIFEALLKPHQP